MDVTFNKSFANGLSMALKQPVLGLQWDLAVGDLTRLKTFDPEAWAVQAAQADQPSAEILTKQVQQQRQRLDVAIARGEAIRVWWSEAPADRLGYWWLCDYLQNVSNPLEQVKLPLDRELTTTLPAFQHFSSLAEMDGEVAVTDIDRAQVVSPLACQVIGRYWQETVQEAAALRVSMNGTIIGVPVDFLDPLFAQQLQPGQSLTWSLGRILGALPLGLPEWWIHSRINIINNK